MSGNCSFCGATINFGLKFCVVCGRHVVADNKMGGSALKGLRSSDLTKHINEDYTEAQKQSKRRALRFRRTVRTFGQTVFYGFIAGALFFCAVRFALEAVFPGTIKRFVVPLIEPVFRGSSQPGNEVVKKDIDAESQSGTKPTKSPSRTKPSRRGHSGRHGKRPVHSQ